MYTRISEPAIAKNAGAVFRLKYHVGWCPKYRRSVLVKPVDVRLQALLRRKAEAWGRTMHAREVRPDHVHRFVAGGPTIGVAEMVHRRKGFPWHARREEFPFRQSRLPTLGSRSYSAGWVGSVREAVVGKYIAGQKGK